MDRGGVDGGMGGRMERGTDRGMDGGPDRSTDGGTDRRIVGGTDKGTDNLLPTRLANEESKSPGSIFPQ